ncbi:MAG: type II toxin-antitoxin system VapC family toxin [Kiritimatiellae bacterium]|nr:type II toxin-antitoxin system VapC family toxin [Kiritimatiellia bacterium]
MKYVLDTHVWIWWNMRPEKLSAKVRTLLATPRRYEEVLLSAISPWEFSKLLEKGRLGVSCDPEEWIHQALDMPKLRLVPLSPTLAYRSTVLPPALHGDPADQIIIATAREENATVLTKDKIMRAYTHVRTLW